MGNNWTSEEQWTQRGDLSSFQWEESGCLQTIESVFWEEMLQRNLLVYTLLPSSPPAFAEPSRLCSWAYHAAHGEIPQNYILSSKGFNTSELTQNDYLCSAQY